MQKYYLLRVTDGNEIKQIFISKLDMSVGNANILYCYSGTDLKKIKEFKVMLQETFEVFTEDTMDEIFLEGNLVIDNGTMHVKDTVLGDHVSMEDKDLCDFVNDIIRQMKSLDNVTEFEDINTLGNMLLKIVRTESGLLNFKF